MDFETVLINNIHVPYLLSWFDGNISKSYFIASLEPNHLEDNTFNMIKEAIDDLSKKKYNNYHIYFHNFAKFDGYFLIKHLSKLGLTNPIINDGKIISLGLTTFNRIHLTFKDSLLLIPGSLRKLCDSFSIPMKKGIFPYLFTDINYVGNVPDFKYFIGVSLNDYNEYKKIFTYKTWSFKEEAKIYCELDCTSLYYILTKFNKLVFSLDYNDEIKYLY